MSDTNKVEAVVNPPDGDELGWSFVKPKHLVPSVFEAHGWVEPAVSLFCEATIFNIDSPNAALELRLPDNTAYFTAVKEIMVQYWNGTGVYAGLSDEEGAILATANAAAAMESITEAGGRELAIENYKKELGLYVAPPEERVGRERQRPRSFPAGALTGLTPILGNIGEWMD